MGTERGIYEKLKGSKIWWIRWTDRSGRKRREKAGNLTAAKILLAKRKTEKLQASKFPENSHLSLLFGELMDDALEYSRAANGARSAQELKLKIERLRPVWGSRKATAIKKQEIIRWLQDEKAARDWSPATTNRWQACFSLIFRVGIDNERVAANPASRIKRIAENNGAIRFLTFEEEGRAQSVLSTRCATYLPAFLLALHTGMRPSEQWRLKWADVDLDRRFLTVRKQKRGNRERHIPLNHIAVSVLESVRVDAAHSDPVFRNSEGGAMTDHRGWFNPAMVEAQVSGVTWKALRHTFASRLVMAGVDLRTVADLLGHSTIQMTMRYAHLSPEHKQAAVERLAHSSDWNGHQSGH